MPVREGGRDERLERNSSEKSRIEIAGATASSSHWLTAKKTRRLAGSAGWIVVNETHAPDSARYSAVITHPMGVR